MIYAGLIDFNNTLNLEHELSAVINSYIDKPSTVIKKSYLTLCYGKLITKKDMGEIWENNFAVLLGHIFPRNLFPNFTKLKELNSNEILKKLWGQYIYINSNKKLKRIEVIIDSTGQLPFFYYSFSNGNVIFSSHIEIIFKILDKKLDYNWDYFCSYLLYGNSSSIQTPFKDIYELPPACRLAISKNEIKTEPFWNPLNSYNEPELQKEDPVDALQVTLKSLIEPYKNICVSLSGGLDSSSLVYCLQSIKRKEQSVSALNYFHRSIKSSNELIHAQKVCHETGTKLIEVDISHTLPFDYPYKKKPLNPNKPLPGLINLRWLENISDYLPQDAASIFLSGHGSDHIFMRPPTKKSLVDYIIEKGIRGSTEKLKYIAQFYRDPFLSIIQENIKGLSSYIFAYRLGKRHPKNIQDETPDWFSQLAIKNTLIDFMHPIYNDLPSHLLPGKYDQIDAVYEGLASIHEELDPINPTFYPYLYQPIVEFALSIPTYNLFDKGYDRYPLRKSTSDHFKTKTVWRRDKSETTGILQLGIKKNLEYILNLCLEGYLVKQGLIDKKKLHETIILLSNGDTKHLWPFIHLASIEIFLGLWEEKFCEQ